MGTNGKELQEVEGRQRAWVQGGKRSAVACMVKAGSLMVQRCKAEDRRQKSKAKGLPAQTLTLII